MLKKLLFFIKSLFFKRNRIFFVGNSTILPEKLSFEEEVEILTKLRNGDESVRDVLIERNLRLVVYIAQKFEKTGASIEDLISIGTVGLIKSIKSFDVNKNIKIATYSSRCIENEILMYLRKLVKRRAETSLDNPLNVDSDGNELLLSDVIGTEPDMLIKEYENAVEIDLLHSAIENLNPRERVIMKMRYGLGGESEMTQKEVADELKISQSYISRLEKKILYRLKIELDKQNKEIVI